MAILRNLIEVIIRIDPGLWYLLDLRRRSTASWVPAALLLALFAFGAAECLVAGNTVGAAFLSAIALPLFGAKLRAAAHG
jgi:hypothetical protein